MPKKTGKKRFPLLSPSHWALGILMGQNGTNKTTITNLFLGFTESISRKASKSKVIANDIATKKY